MPRDEDEPEPVVTQIKAYAVGSLQPHLRIKWRDTQGEHSLILERRSMVGSAPSADIVVLDPTVSRIHAELEPKDDGIWIRDLGSKNGTFILGVLVQSARLPPGVSVRVGATDLHFDVVDAPSKETIWPSDRFGHLIGKSPVMHELFHYLERVSASDASVLIRGETGTGKEVVARSIHDVSPRRSQPFVVVDCGAIPENLIESELFGAIKGAFTGAQNTRVGAIEAADGGTVFFDEIGELPLAMQPKLLRVLESREIRRLGEPSARRVDVRFLSASHRDLRQMVNAGAFREDLYFRLAVVPVIVPPLREHLDDIPLLVEHFLPRGASAPSADVISELATRPWLGNVRELRNFIERGVAVGMDRALSMSSSEPPIAVASPSSPPPPRPSSSPPPKTWTLPVTTEQTFKSFREQWLDFGEREYVRQLLDRHQRKVAAAADTAALDRTYLYRLIRKHLL